MGPAIEGIGSWFKGADVVEDLSTTNFSTTIHGSERIAGAGATRGGVLSAEEIAATRAAGQTLTQADGAIVKVAEVNGKYNVVVSGQKGIITTFKNISEKSLIRLSKNYGWK